MDRIRKSGKIFVALFLISSLIFGNFMPVFAATIKTNQVKKSSLNAGASKTYEFELTKTTKITLTYDGTSSTQAPADTVFVVKQFKDKKHTKVKKTYWNSTQLVSYGKSISKTMTLPKGYYTVSLKNKSTQDYNFKLTLFKTVDSTSSLTLTATAKVQIGTPSVLVAKDAKGNAITPTKITWSSSDPSVATVNRNGVVQGVKPGTCLIKAQLTNGKTASCKVTVPTASLLQQLQTQPYYAYVYNVTGNKCYVKFYNNLSKPIDYLEFDLYQYNNAKYIIESSRPLIYYVNDTIPQKSTAKYYFNVDSRTKYARAYISKVQFSDGTELENPMNGTVTPSGKILRNNSLWEEFYYKNYEPK